MSERKFKIGDVVKPIKTDPDSHDFEDWEILTITRVSDGDPNLFECTRSDGDWDLLWGFELELVEGDKTYTHEEVAEILGISKDEVETVSVDITPKEYDRFEWSKPDMVNHPKHYTKGGIETLDFILAKVEGLSPQEAVLVGHIIRYVSRYNDKFNPVEDLKKAKFYLDKLIELREELD